MNIGLIIFWVSMVLVVGFIGWSLFVCIIQAENKRLLRGMGRY